MGFLNSLLGALGGGPTETCPECGSRMSGDGERFECPNCVDGGVYFMEDGELVDSMSRSRGNAGSCINCNGSLSGAEHTSEWEDGDNSEAYVICRHCQTQNYV
ncbi:DNA-directed RNA polymerase subunit RPC12/RpoP [Conyzicola nivalis]|uniref:DNA-directed RNA polymerase subunit RPC12/RpoP n=1 Tax=Conyzicola nivalis TaxID=1477021 RepID=A0ABV2QIW0_9MICO